MKTKFWFIPLVILADFYLGSLAFELISTPADFAVLSGIIILMVLSFLNYKFYKFL